MVFGYVALSGPLAPLRILLSCKSPPKPAGLAFMLAQATGLSPLVFAVVLGLGALAWGLMHAPLRAEPMMIVWGVLAGLAVIWAYAGTSWLYHESLGEVGVEGPSFTAPIGRTLIYLMTSTAGGLTFSVGSVSGVLIGAFAGSSLRGLFRWEACEDPRELGRQVSGAALMGIGGVIALGCSVGQGVSAFATLAWSGPVTLAAIAAGAALGLRHLIGGFQPE
ncbi:MAG: YeeE/YedE thiosulfate transporter family protein [Paracoccaceae bacterium]